MELLIFLNLLLKNQQLFRVKYMNNEKELDEFYGFLITDMFVIKDLETDKLLTDEQLCTQQI